MSILRTVFLFAVLNSANAVAGERLTVAVASNFHATAQEVGRLFSSTTGIDVRISSGSTGKLYAQLIHGAPYDVFLAADSARPKLLEDSGDAINGSRFTYATGSLVLWSADPSLLNEDCRDALVRGAYHHLAIANPLTAPYGLAAKEVLQAEALFDVAERRMVYGENIAQTLHFVATGNATLGLIATSQLKAGLPVTTSCSWNVPPSMHSSLDQQAVLLTRSSNVETAGRFLTFMRSPEVVAILERRGYTVPE